MWELPEIVDLHRPTSVSLHTTSTAFFTWNNNNSIHISRR